MSNLRNHGRPTGSHRTDQSDQSDRTDRSEEAAHRDRTLRASGGYRKLRSFQVATVIYDATVSFCDRFVDKRSRTHDQMVQAARSGRQNIAEGSRASATSSQTELRLVNVARASLDELLLDYEDFLRQRGLTQWGKDDPRAQAVREVGKRSDRTNRSDQTDRSDWKAYAQWLSQPNPEVTANAIICLIHQANYLLDRQVAGLERQFIDEGATANGSQRQESRSGESNLLWRAKALCVQYAARPWPCGLPARGRMQDRDSGDAAVTLSAGALVRWRHQSD